MKPPFNQPVFVTRPFLPRWEDFSDGLREIWNSGWLTNNGPILQRFTGLLEIYCANKNVSLFSNGTLALQIGLQGLGVSGEAITTPFTFVATAHALYWNNIRPVFVDIEPDHYTLDPEKVEAAITPWTRAILAVHVFGHPCRLKELGDIARRHNLVLLYDAAHAFGVSVDGVPIGNFGDTSMFSFHATKLFHSIEGGMLVFSNPALKRTFDYLKNFGFESETEVVLPGTNAKMNEFQALMGIQVLAHIDELIEKRRRIAAIYRERIADIPGMRMPPSMPVNVSGNYAYLPVEISDTESPVSRDQVYEGLKKYNVFARRYFFPLVSKFPCYRTVAPVAPMPVAEGVSERILTLPIFHDLALDDVHRICDMIQELATS